MRAFLTRRGTMGIVGITVGVILALAPAWAAKTDVLTLINGDRVTGEVKELSQSLLRYKTDSMGAVSVEWVDVVRLVSDLTFQVEIQNGDFYYGALLEPDEDRVLRVGLGKFQIDLEMVQVVGITRIKHGFWNTLDGSVSLGFQATKATQVVQTSFMGNVERRTRRDLTQVDLRVIISSTAGQPATKNNNLGFSRDRFLGHRFAAGGSLQFQQNDELGIDFRTLLGANATRSLVQGLRQRLTSSAGLSYNRENVADGGTDESMEAMLNLNWSIYRYKSPKTDFYFKWYVYPSVTERGRVRSQLDTQLRHELVKDFFLSFTVVYSFDSDPPNQEAASHDYSATVGVSWSF